MSRRAIAFLALLLLPASGFAQQRSMGTIPVNGSELFRFALHLKGIEPLDSPGLAINDPQSSIIIILGNTNDLGDLFTGAPGTELRQFVLTGGAILIATDTPNRPPPGRRGNRGWAETFGINVTGLFVVAGPDRTYRSRADRPFVKPVRPVDLFKDVEPSGSKAVATDQPSAMSVQAGNPEFIIDRLAGYPDGAQLQLTGGRLPAEFNNFAVSFFPRGAGPGHMLVLADHSVFANGMMGFPEAYDGAGDLQFSNGNWEFTKRTIEWLQGGRAEPRKQCLFIQNNKIIKQFAVPIPPTPKPPIPDLPPDVMANLILNSMNPIIDEAQEKNLFNRILEGWLGFPRLVRLFVYVVTAIFVLAGLRWLARGQRKVEPGTTLTASAQAALLPRGGVLRQRTAAQIEVANLYEAAARRVRDRFDVLGGRPLANGGMPPVLVAGDVNDAIVLRRTVEWLWSIGFGDRPICVAPSEWDQMNTLLERVMVRAARGHWSFGQEA